MPVLAAHPCALASRLVEVAEEQTGALESGDVLAFERLADERAALLPAIEDGVSSFELRVSGSDLKLETRNLKLVRKGDLLSALERVADIDRRNIALLGSLIQETSRSLDEARQGRGAVQRYQKQTALLGQRAPILDWAG